MATCVKEAKPAHQFGQLMLTILVSYYLQGSSSEAKTDSGLPTLVIPVVRVTGDAPREQHQTLHELEDVDGKFTKTTI